MKLGTTQGLKGSRVANVNELKSRTDKIKLGAINTRRKMLVKYAKIAMEKSK